jgi:hypothetical protein
VELGDVKLGEFDRDWSFAGSNGSMRLAPEPEGDPFSQHPFAHAAGDGVSTSSTSPHPMKSSLVE